MIQKKPFYTELAYVAGILLLALGTAFMARADFGMSMVVAPAYLLHLKISQTFPFYSFGMSEYVLQAVLLVVLAFLMGRFRKSYLFSFATAVFYGFALDGCMALVRLIPPTGTGGRVIFFVLGMLIGALAISLFFHSYLPPEAYELFVKEVAEKGGWSITRTKTTYDIVSCIVSVLMSFAFFGFGHFEGVKAGTFISALLNGWLIGHFGTFLEQHLDFKDAMPWRNFFEN